MSQPLQRVSNIPRPTKLLGQQHVNHASKPIANILPRTPATKIINNQNLNKPERKTLALKSIQQQECDPEVAVLELTPFCRQPIVNFGHVQVETTQSRTVVLRNSQQSQQQLFVITFPKPIKGLYIDATEFLIAGRAETSINIAWTPKNVGSIRETITFQDINRMPRRIVILGTAYKPPPDIPKPPKSIHRSMYRCNRFPTRLSPNKSNRKLDQARTQLIFSPASKRYPPKLQDGAENNLLTKLDHDSRRRQSALMVRKILSQFDTSMATKVQTYCRMVLAKRQLSGIREESNNVVAIQSFFRMILARRDFEVIRTRHRAATKVKAYLKMCVTRTRFLEMRQSATLIQARWRGILARKEMTRTKSIVALIVRLQSYGRGMMIRSGQLRQLREQRDTVVKVQSYIRMILAQRDLEILRNKHESATKIESYWRMYIAMKRYSKVRDSVITIQAFWRGTVVRRQQARLKSLLGLIVGLQSYGRGMIIRRGMLRHLREQREAVISVQSYARMILVRRHFLKVLKIRHESASIIKAHWKRYIARRRYLRLRELVICVQARLRGNMARRELDRLKFLAAIIVRIQTHGRGMITRKRLERSIQALHGCQRRAIADRFDTSQEPTRVSERSMFTSYL